MDSIGVCEYFDNKSVLILGSTGFLGKCLLEKLLRSVPTLKSIYCLIRPLNNKTAQQRLCDVFVSPLFTVSGAIGWTDGRSSKSPTGKHPITNVIALNGDLEADHNLGLCHDDLDVIRKEVTCVFNMVGSSKLDEDLKVALTANVKALNNILMFCETVDNLKALVCISSIYTNCDRTQHIEEMIYANGAAATATTELLDPVKVIRAFDWMSNEMVNAAKKHLMQGKPNSFVYTKWLAECMLDKWFKEHKPDSSKNFGIAVIRPSMIGATYREPFAGWIDEKGAVQPGDLFIATAQGYLRTMRGHHGYLDIIPVDVLSGLIIAASVYTCNQRLNELTVYHCTTDGGCLKTPECAQILNKVASHNVPFERAFRRPHLSVTGSSLMHHIAIIYSHLLPALFGDAARVLIFKKPYFLSVYRGLHKNLNLVQYFTAQKWTLSNQNLLSLYFSLNAEDVQDFFVDPASIDWPQYIEAFLRGAKRFLLKEQECYVKSARNHLRTLRNIRWTFNFLILAFLWRYFIAKSQFAMNLWSVVLSFVYRFLTFLPLTSSSANLLPLPVKRRSDQN